MTPRDVQDYEAQARELVRRNWIDYTESTVKHIAAALRAAGRRAQSRTAMLAAGMVRGLTAPTRGEISELARQIQDLASAPESPPGPAAYVDALQDPVHATPGKLLYSRPLRPPAPSQAAPTEPQPPRWRIGRHYGIHVYCGDTPIATFHTVEAATAAVRAYNANLDRQGAATGEEG